MTTDYIVIPGTDTKLYDGTVVILSRLPGTKWIIHCGYYHYNGKRQKGWYFSAIPSESTMPVFKEDLYGITVVDGPVPGPTPPTPPGPVPPEPTPLVFTETDKDMIDRSMITVATLEDRDKLSDENNIAGKIVRVNDSEGSVEYYEWDATSTGWIPATLGLRYMTREEITTDLNECVAGIVYSDSLGALVVTKKDESTENVLLTGVAHNPVYVKEDLTLTIPVFGKEDLVITIPKDRYLKSVRYEKEYHTTSGEVIPALVFTMTDGETEEEIVCDATAISGLYTGKESDTIKVSIDSKTNEIEANVKLSSVDYNAIKVDTTGLIVDISGKLDKNTIQEGYLLIADGLGGFTYAGDGIAVRNSGKLSDYTNKDVVTAQIIADAISAAVSSTQTTIEKEISELSQKVTEMESSFSDLHDEVSTYSSRIAALENNSVGQGESGSLVVSTSSGVVRSGVTIGGQTLSTEDTYAVATEAAVKDALAWKDVSTT